MLLETSVRACQDCLDLGRPADWAFLHSAGQCNVHIPGDFYNRSPQAVERNPDGSAVSQNRAENPSTHDPLPQDGCCLRDDRLVATVHLGRPVTDLSGTETQDCLYAVVLWFCQLDLLPIRRNASTVPLYRDRPPRSSPEALPSAKPHTTGPEAARVLLPSVDCQRQASTAGYTIRRSRGVWTGSILRIAGSKQ